MALKQAFLLVASVWLVAGQRPSFAGTKPIGFPEVIKPTDALGNRFGDDTPLVLPLEARGDRDLVERISKLPVDQQPFWYINWKALEDLRKNPVTYQQRPNTFTDEGVLAASQIVPSSDLTSKFGTNNQNLNNQTANNQNLNNQTANNQSLNNQAANNQNLSNQNTSNQTPSNAQNSRRNYRNSNRHSRYTRF